MANAEFPVDVPVPGSLYGGEIDKWYESAVARISEFIDLSDPQLYDLEEVWATKSRLRFGGAMGLIDQELATQFLRNNPLPTLEELVALAERTSPSEPLEETAKLLLATSSKPVSELRVVQNTSYDKVVMPDGNGEMCVQTPDGWKTLHPLLPPRPVVPNPEYLPEIKPFYATASVWQDVPSFSTNDSDLDAPCVLVTGSKMWLGYKTEDNRVSVVEFSTYIEHHESRVGSLLASHPYFSAGLVPLAFNILSESLLTRYWSRFSAHHWIVNFQDRTIDIIAGSAQQVDEPVAGISPIERVLEVVKRTQKKSS